jgi:hypothetical protein
MLAAALQAPGEDGGFILDLVDPLVLALHLP